MKLTEAQRQLVTAHEGAVIVHARAGSGKTTGIIHNLIDKYSVKGINPQQVIVSTFSKESSLSLKRKLASFYGRFLEEAPVGTCHSLCWKILSRYNRLPAGYDIMIKPWQARQAVFSVVPKSRLAHGEEMKLLGALGWLKSHACSRDSSVAKLRDNYKIYMELLADRSIDTDTVDKIWTSYEYKKAQLNVIDYDDILIRTYELLVTNPEVRDQLQNWFTHLVVDEYQDTNTIQYEIYKILAAPQNNIIVVGDEYQSIYGFRGSYPIYMEQFRRDYPNAMVLEFLENFRSVPTVLGAANQVIAEAAQTSNSQAVPVRQSNETEPVVVIVSDGKQEAEFVSGSIKESTFTYEEIAILCRFNSQQFLIEEALMTAGIPYRTTDNKDFYERNEIQAALRYLELIHMADDELALDHYKEIAWKPIQTNSVDNKRWTSMAALLTTSTGKVLNGKIQFLRETVASNNYSAEVALNEIIYGMIDLSRYAKEYVNTMGDEVALNNLEALKDFSKGRTVTQLLQTIEWLKVNKQKNKDAADRVTISTIHKAKGLEWDEVYIVGCNEGIFPAKNAFGDSEQMEEERRIMYVAMTRPKEVLICTAHASLEVSRYIASAKDKFKYAAMAHRSMFHESFQTLPMPNDIGAHGEYYVETETPCTIKP